MRILLTGSTGCTGSYLLKELSQTHEVIALFRSKAKQSPFQSLSNVQWIQGDLHDLLTQKKLLQSIDHCVHPATVWGGEDTFKVNVKQTLGLIKQLSSTKCQGFHYFSTASLLNAQHKLQIQALTQGTNYIRSKAVAHEHIQNITSVPVHIYYPTVILGGNDKHPYTPVSKFLPQIKNHIKWAQWIRATGKFHWIHAADIARIVHYRILNKKPAQEIILGNPAYSIARLQKELIDFYGIKPAFAKCNLDYLLPFLLPLLSSRMEPWDRFSLKHRHIGYRCFNSKTYKLPSEGEHISDFL